MNCPHCNERTSVTKMLKVSRWKNFECPKCNRESTVSVANNLIVLLSTFGLAKITELGLGYVGFSSGVFIHIALIIFYLFICEYFLAKLVPLNET